MSTQMNSAEAPGCVLSFFSNVRSAARLLHLTTVLLSVWVFVPVSAAKSVTLDRWKMKSLSERHRERQPSRSQAVPLLCLSGVN